MSLHLGKAPGGESRREPPWAAMQPRCQEWDTCETPASLASKPPCYMQCGSKSASNRVRVRSRARRGETCARRGRTCARRGATSARHRTTHPRLGETRATCAASCATHCSGRPTCVARRATRRRDHATRRGQERPHPSPAAARIGYCSSACSRRPCTTAAS